MENLSQDNDKDIVEVLEELVSKINEIVNWINSQ
tara:strand:- start:1562 stop:1663 length:102 start_codon:yes stop_codon:yes gene_type:complete